MDTSVTVVCAMILKEGKYLVARRKAGRSNGGKWEFPGGKLEGNETEVECLQREILEELGMNIRVISRSGEHTHAYPGSTVRLIAYLCEPLSTSVSLQDHDLVKWLSPGELLTLDMTEADKPFLKGMT